MHKGRRLFIGVTTTAVVVAIGGPYFWDAFINKGHYPIDWQAWWAFCTFLIAVIAGVVAFNEYTLHKTAQFQTEEESKPKLIIATDSEKDLGIKGKFNLRVVRIVNVGKSPATSVTAKANPSVSIEAKSGEAGLQFSQLKINVLMPGESRVLFSYSDPDLYITTPYPDDITPEETQIEVRYFEKKIAEITKLRLGEVNNDLFYT